MYKSYSCASSGWITDPNTLENFLVMFLFISAYYLYEIASSIFQSFKYKQYKQVCPDEPGFLFSNWKWKSGWDWHAELENQFHTKMFYFFVSFH